MTYKITIDVKYSDVYHGTLEIIEDGKTRYKSNVVIFAKLMDKIREYGYSYDIRYKSVTYPLIPLCPTIAVGRTTIPITGINGKSKHDHPQMVIYLVSLGKTYVYDGNIVNLSRKLYDKSTKLEFEMNIIETLDESYFFSADTVYSESDEENDDWSFTDEDF